MAYFGHSQRFPDVPEEFNNHAVLFRGVIAGYCLGKFCNLAASSSSSLTLSSKEKLDRVH